MKYLIGFMAYVLVLVAIIATTAVLLKRPKKAATSGKSGDDGFEIPWIPFFWILFIAVVAAISYYGLYKPVWNPGFADVNRIVWSHWLGLVLLFVAFAVAISFLVPAAKSKQLWYFLFGIAAFLFIGTWLLDWGGRQFSPAATSQRVEAPTTRCPPATSQERRGCNITSDEWSPAVRVENGRDIGMIICHSRGILSRRTDEGATLLYFRAWDKDGTGHVKDRVEYQMYPLGTDCRLVGY